VRATEGSAPADIRVAGPEDEDGPKGEGFDWALYETRFAATESAARREATELALLDLLTPADLFAYFEPPDEGEL